MPALVADGGALTPLMSRATSLVESRHITMATMLGGAGRNQASSVKQLLAADQNRILILIQAWSCEIQRLQDNA